MPNRTGLDLSRTKREDAIGIQWRLHASCSDVYFQIGSGRLICQLNGKWKYDIVCEDKTGYTPYIIMKFWMSHRYQIVSNESGYIFFYSLFCIFSRFAQYIILIPHVLWKNTIYTWVNDGAFKRLIKQKKSRIFTIWHLDNLIKIRDKLNSEIQSLNVWC